MTTRMFHVDAFARRPFSGNPAVICLLDSPRDETWMQKVAAEMNQSETAAVQRDGKGFHIRWFTPTVEVDLCGHATLAAAHVLWETGVVPEDVTIPFTSRSGLLPVSRLVDRLAMDLPTDPPQSDLPGKELSCALGVEVREAYQCTRNVLALVQDEQTLRSITPDLARVASCTTFGVIVTSPCETDAYDFVSRFFAPAAGVDEDPVTGSAHCALGPFWQQRTGRDRLMAYQASARGGEVRLLVHDDRVTLEGQAVTVMKSEWLEP